MNDLEVQNPSAAQSAQSGSSQTRQKKHFSRFEKIIFLILGLIIVALIGFIAYRTVDRNKKELAYKNAIDNREQDSEQMSLMLADEVKLHYEKGNYSSIKPYIEQTIDLYEDGADKIEALSVINGFLNEQKDYECLASFYKRIVIIATESKMNKGTIEYYKNLLSMMEEYD